MDGPSASLSLSEEDRVKSESLPGVCDGERKSQLQGQVTRTLFLTQRLEAPPCPAQSGRGSHPLGIFTWDSAQTSCKFGPHAWGRDLADIPSLSVSWEVGGTGRGGPPKKPRWPRPTICRVSPKPWEEAVNTQAHAHTRKHTWGPHSSPHPTTRSAHTEGAGLEGVHTADTPRQLEAGGTDLGDGSG